jgi:hypothetical protein
MKTIFRSLVFAFGVFAVGVQAADEIALKKVKTAILPSGGFYSIYEATCYDKSVVTLASLDGSRRWCIASAGELACEYRSRSALLKACAQSSLAAGEEPETLDSIQ